jgi:hypothetical protein
MSIYMGSDEVHNEYRGDTLLEAVYFGPDLVWPIGGPPPYVDPPFGSVVTLQGFDGAGVPSEEWRTDEASGVLWQVYPFGQYPADVSTTPTVFDSIHSVFFDAAGEGSMAVLRAGADRGFIAGISTTSYFGPSTKECWIYPVNATANSTKRFIFTLSRDTQSYEPTQYTWALTMDRDTYVLSGSIQHLEAEYLELTLPTPLIPNQWNHVFFQLQRDDPVQPYFGIGGNGEAIWSGDQWDGSSRPETPYISSIGGRYDDPDGLSVNAYLDEVRMTRNWAVYENGSATYSMPPGLFPRS